MTHESLRHGAARPCGARAADDHAALQEFAYTLDAGGKIIQTDVTNPRGYVRRLTFNAAGRVLTDTPAHGTALAQTTTYTRHATSQRVESVTDALGRQTTYGYDAHNNVTGVTRLAGTGAAATTTFTTPPDGTSLRPPSFE